MSTESDEHDYGKKYIPDLPGEWLDFPYNRKPCLTCDQAVPRFHILWANQFGIKTRFFCHWCGAWWDIKHLYGKSLTGERRK
jgi:hypothetical protein